MSLASRIDLKFVILAPTANHTPYVHTARQKWFQLWIEKTMHHIKYLNFVHCNLNAIDRSFFISLLLQRLHSLFSNHQKGKTCDCARNGWFIASMTRGSLEMHMDKMWFPLFFWAYFCRFPMNEPQKSLQRLKKIFVSRSIMCCPCHRGQYGFWQTDNNCKRIYKCCSNSRKEASHRFELKTYQNLDWNFLKSEFMWTSNNMTRMCMRKCKTCSALTCTLLFCTILAFSLTRSAALLSLLAVTLHKHIMHNDAYFPLNAVSLSNIRVIIGSRCY